MTYLKFFIGILAIVIASRVLPHPPNFTPLIALSLYCPIFLGAGYIYAVLLSFVLTDIFIGFHQTLLFTWGSIFIIGILSRYFCRDFKKRILGASIASIFFFIITNFGVYLTGMYGYSFDGLIKCYFMAIPFFTNTIVSTIIFSLVIEILIKINYQRKVLK